ncbi:hypothetical protein A1D15_1745 [Lactiplantibacillus plantarum]|nr:hypothetical protein LpLQ80_15900 [Lactiplantibacillus plantarum]KZU93774.1 hypothetical protein A1D15_1745 [Lactiplantibacillus plantarum]MBF9193487.1 hypothetical protein [Lactiplantibacillus plantarum]
MMKKLTTGWRYLKEHSRLRRFFIIGLYLVLTGGLIINYGLLNRQTTKNDDTPLNSYQSFSGDNSAQGVKLVQRQYSPTQQRLIATFEVQASTDPTTEILSQYLHFKLATVVPQNLKMVVIPVTENKYVVMVDHLNQNFEAIRFRLVNATPQTDQTSSSAPQADFIVTNQAKIRQAHVSDLSPKAFASQAINDEISARNTSIKRQQNKIKIAKTAISADHDKIQTKRTDRQYEVASQQTQTDSDIETLTGDIEQNQQNITSAKHRISTLKAEQALLKKKQTAIRNGTFKLAKVTKSTQITHKN